MTTASQTTTRRTATTKTRKARKPTTPATPTVDKTPTPDPAALAAAADAAATAAATATPPGIYPTMTAATYEAAAVAATHKLDVLSDDVDGLPCPAGRKALIWYSVVPLYRGHPIKGPIVHTAKVAMADIATHLTVSCDPVWHIGDNRNDPGEWTRDEPETDEGADPVEPSGFMPAVYVSDNGAAIVRATIGVNVKGRGAAAARAMIVKWLKANISHGDLDVDPVVVKDTRVLDADVRRAGAYAMVRRIMGCKDPNGPKLDEKALTDLVRTGGRIARMARDIRTSSPRQVKESTALAGSGGVEFSRKTRGPVARV
jgi:hypothetical protein